MMMLMIIIILEPGNLMVNVEGYAVVKEGKGEKRDLIVCISNGPDLDGSG